MFDEPDVPAEVHWAKAGRGPLDYGPGIITPSAGLWLPPQLDKTRKKLVDKVYQTNAPLELFAYSEHEPTIAQCIKTRLPASKFQRVPVFNLGFLQLVYRFPEQAPGKSV